MSEDTYYTLPPPPDVGDLVIRSIPPDEVTPVGWTRYNSVLCYRTWTQGDTGNYPSHPSWWYKPVPQVDMTEGWLDVLNDKVYEGNPERFCACPEGPVLGTRQNWARPRCSRCRLFVFEILPEPKEDNG